MVYNALVFYEESYYRASIVRLQEKLRNSKPDEKLRDQLIQSIEKDNQMTIDIIKHVQKDYITKLEPYLNQYQVISINTFIQQDNNNTKLLFD